MKPKTVMMLITWNGNSGHFLKNYKYSVAVNKYHYCFEELKLFTLVQYYRELHYFFKCNLIIYVKLFQQHFQFNLTPRYFQPS